MQVSDRHKKPGCFLTFSLLGGGLLGAIAGLLALL